MIYIDVADMFSFDPVIIMGLYAAFTLVALVSWGLKHGQK